VCHVGKRGCDSKATEYVRYVAHYTSRLRKWENKIKLKLRPKNKNKNIPGGIIEISSAGASTPKIARDASRYDNLIAHEVLSRH
jgi:hypothetical protein